MANNPSKDKKVLRRGSWRPEEDEKLVSYIARYGVWNWNQLPKYAGLSRTGKSCRLRWLNYLRPGIKHGNITREEEETIAKLHKIMGNRWAAIASRLPQRTDNEIKNYYNTRMKKRTQMEMEDVVSMTDQIINDSPDSSTSTNSSSTMEENSSPVVSYDVPRFNASSHCQEVAAVRAKEEEYAIINVYSFLTYNNYYEDLILPVEGDGLSDTDSFHVPLDDFFWASSLL